MSPFRDPMSIADPPTDPEWWRIDHSECEDLIRSKDIDIAPVVGPATETTCLSAHGVLSMRGARDERVLVAASRDVPRDAARGGGTGVSKADACPVQARSGVLDRAGAKLPVETSGRQGRGSRRLSAVLTRSGNGKQERRTDADIGARVGDDFAHPADSVQSPFR